MKTFSERGVTVVAYIEHWQFISPRYGWMYSGTHMHNVSNSHDPYFEAKKLCAMWAETEHRYKLRDREPFGVVTKEQTGNMGAEQFRNLVQRANQLDANK